MSRFDLVCLNMSLATLGRGLTRIGAGTRRLGARGMGRTAGSILTGTVTTTKDMRRATRTLRGTVTSLGRTVLLIRGVKITLRSTGAIITARRTFRAGSMTRRDMGSACGATVGGTGAALSRTTSLTAIRSTVGDLRRTHGICICTTLPGRKRALSIAFLVGGPGNSGSRK